jgi:hypothetical protein
MHGVARAVRRTVLLSTMSLTSAYQAHQVHIILATGSTNVGVKKNPFTE